MNQRAVQLKNVNVSLSESLLHLRAKEECLLLVNEYFYSFLLLVQRSGPCRNAIATSRRVVGRARVLAHEGIIDRLLALEYLAMHFALVVVPDLATRLREHGFDRQQKPHLLRLEYTTLRIDERDALALENKTRLQLSRGQVIVHLARPAFAHSRKTPRE